MTETPEAKVARLQRELANAKVAALQQELAEAQGSAGRDISAGNGGGWDVRPTSRAKAPVVADTRLAPAPRSVPLAFRAIVLPWSWWTIFALFMVIVAPIALWIFVPIAGAVAVAATFVVIMAVSLRRYRLPLALLKWGDVATVRNTGLLSRGTYYSGTTYRNVRLPKHTAGRSNGAGTAALPRRLRSTTS